MSKRTIEQSANTKERVYQFIIKYITKNNFAPTVREIGKAVGLQSTSSVYEYLIQLQNEGRIETKKGRYRTIRIISCKEKVAESQELKRQASDRIRKMLIKSGDFDVESIDKIIEVFNTTAECYIFKRK